MNHSRLLEICSRAISASTTLLAALVITVLLQSAANATPQKAAGLYEDALGRFEKNDVAGAIIQLKNALQQDQTMLAAHLLLGKALLRNGDLKAAEAAFEEAQRQGINRAELALPLGSIYLALGRPEQVIERIPASGLPTALQVEVLTMRGNAYVEAGNARMATQSFDEARKLDSTSASPLIAEIPMLLSAGELAHARANADQAVALAPNNAQAWNMKASVLHASFEMAAALAAYDRTLNLEPRHVDARIARAALFIDLKREDDARKDLDALVAAAQNDPRTAYLRALLASRQGDGAAVAAHLADVTRLIDTLPPAWLARREQLLMAGALAHHGLGNLQKAREYLDLIIARNSRHIGARKLLASIYVDTREFRRALPLLEALSRAEPNDPQIMFLLGSVHMAQHRYLQASELLEAAAARTGSAEMKRTLAFSQLELGQDEVGQANLEKAFAANPGDTRGGTALAMIYIRQGETLRALRTAEKMVAQDAGNLMALNFLGSIKGASGDKAGARAAYAQVLAKNPLFRPSILNIVRLDISEQRFDEARRKLDELLAKRHDDGDVLFEYGLLEQRLGRIAEAVRYLQKASEVQRRDSRAGLALIALHLGQRRADLALDTAKTLASKLPDNLDVQLALGRTYLAMGDLSSARSVLTGATRLAEYDAATQVQIARLQQAAGNPDGAAYSIQKALQGRPDDPTALAQLVDIEIQRGDGNKANEALGLLMAKHPERVETALANASLAMSRRQFPAAVAAYRTALERQESTGNAIALARAYLAANQANKAATFLEDWLKTRPADISAQKALAESQFRAGQASATTTQTFRSNYGTETISSGVTVTALANTGGRNNASGAPNNGATQTIQRAVWKNTWGGIKNADACSSGSYCDVNEGYSPAYAIDNNQRYEMALLSFASAVRLSEMRLGWVSGDSDVTVMAYQGIGTPSLIGKTFGQLISLGWASVGNYSDLDTTTKSINSAGLISSYWLIGAYNPLANPGGGSVTGGSTSYDYVKLASVGGCISGVPGCTPPTGQAPEPGSLALFGLGMIGMISLRRRRKA